MNSKWIFLVSWYPFLVLSNFLPGYPFVNKPLFRMDFQKQKQISFALNTLFKSHPCSPCRILMCSSLTLVRLTELASPWLWYCCSTWHLLNPSTQQSLNLMALLGRPSTSLNFSAFATMGGSVISRNSALQPSILKATYFKLGEPDFSGATSHEIHCIDKSPPEEGFDHAAWYLSGTCIWMSIWYWLCGNLSGACSSKMIQCWLVYWDKW